MKEFQIALVGGAVAAVITVVAQYLISYQLIEKPKIDLEKQRIAIEAQKQIALIIPVLKSNCEVSSSGIWTYYIKCETQNLGQYSTRVGIAEVNVINHTKEKNLLFEKTKGFIINFAGGEREYLAPPSSYGSFDFYINMDKKAYPNGMDADDLKAEIVFIYRVEHNVSKILIDAFPEIREEIINMAGGGLKFIMRLPKTTPMALRKK